MQPTRPFRFRGIDADLRRLGTLLRLSLDAAGWVAPPSATVLNLACGRADETGVLLQALCPSATRLYYLGMDLRAPEIEEARGRWIPGAPLGWDLEFRVGDASHTDRMTQLPAFDAVFIRHQNFWHDGPVWTQLYANALATLQPDGQLTITSYFDREHELACACLKQLGARQVINLRHPESRPLPDAPGKSVDRHLAIFAPR